MNRDFPTIYRKIKATVLLVCLFFMLVNTCPIRSLLSSVFLPSVEFSKQAKSVKHPIGDVILMYDDLRCADTEITKASLLDFSLLSKSSLPLPLFLSVISLYLSLSLLSLSSRPFQLERKQTLTNPLPLFLKNRSLRI